MTRTYALTRLRAGDYLLPSNDAQTLWRIYRYEDGRSYGLDEPDRMWWGCARYVGTFEQAQDAAAADLRDVGWVTWERWSEQAGFMRTRAEAIDYALGAVTA